MNELVTYHQTLLTISKSKTEEIKSGNTDNLSKLLMQERKQLQMIEQSEKKRQQIVDDLFRHYGASAEEKTVTELMNHLTDENEQKQLDEAVTNLVNIIVALKEIEQLNNELIQQSMQFVQLSLDMLQPSIQRMNYDQKQTIQESVKQSVFDSKA